MSREYLKDALVETATQQVIEHSIVIEHVFNPVEMQYL